MLGLGRHDHRMVLRRGRRLIDVKIVDPVVVAEVFGCTEAHKKSCNSRGMPL